MQVKVSLRPTKNFNKTLSIMLLIGMFDTDEPANESNTSG